MPMVTCFWKLHVLRDMFCFQVSGWDVINGCVRGASIGELPLAFSKFEKCQAVSLKGDHQVVFCPHSWSLLDSVR